MEKKQKTEGSSWFWILRGNFLIFITSLVVTILSCLVAGIIYSDTFMHWIILVSTPLISGLILVPITRLFLTKGEESRNFWAHFIINTLVFGTFITAAFLTINRCFPTGASRKIKTKIFNVEYVDRINHYSNGRSKRICYTTCTVLIDGKEQDLRFKCGRNLDVVPDMYITLQKGYFGFEVIVDTDPPRFSL